jgi:hypothetical protein
MTRSEEDLPDLARRLSLVTGSNRCSASSSAAPHAPLESFLTELCSVQDTLEDLQEQGSTLNPGTMAEIVGKWATLITSILGDINVAENQRIEDVKKDIAWYNNNLAACEKKLAAAHKEVDEQDKYWINVFAEKRKAWETKLEKQKEAYETKLAKMLRGSSMLSDTQESQSHTNLSTAPSPPESQLQDHDRHASTVDSTDVSEATTLTIANEAQLTLSKDKMTQFTNHNVALPRAKPEAENSADKEDLREKQKQDYEAHVHPKVETQADANTAIKQQPQQRHDLGTPAPSLKRTLSEDGELVPTVADTSSKKRKNGT